MKRFVATLLLMFAAGAARADIVFIDANDQPGERRAAEELGRRHGQRVHILRGQGDGGFQREVEGIFARAATGEVTIDTLVVSGHSSGTSFFGKNGSIDIEALRGIADKHPAVRDGVRHFIGLGCYTATRLAGADWAGAFPRLITLSGFDGIGPSGVWSDRFFTKVYDAIAAARRDAGGTDAGLDQRFADSAVLDGFKRALAALEAVRITNSGFRLCDSFHSVKPQPASKVLEDEARDRTASVFRRYFEATARYEDVPAEVNANTDLRQYYVLLQRYIPMAQDPFIRDELTRYRDQTLRLIYFQNVKRHWSEAHEAKRLAAVRAGVDVPDAATLARMTRKEVLAMVQRLQDVSFQVPAAEAIADVAREQLRDLDTPIRWIE